MIDTNARGNGQAARRCRAEPGRTARRAGAALSYASRDWNRPPTSRCSRPMPEVGALRRRFRAARARPARTTRRRDTWLAASPPSSSAPSRLELRNRFSTTATRWMSEKRGDGRYRHVRTAERRLVVGVAEVTRAEQVRRAFEPRPAAGERDLHLMTRRDVVGELRLRVREAEAQVLLRIQALDHQIEIALARGEQPRATLRSAERPFDDARRVDGADREMALHPVARALAHAEVDFGRGAVAVTLG